jgi:Mn2+/Fe2+ NRAMP family transporter
MSQVEHDRQAILDAKQKGGLATFLTFSRLSGPGWLQGAITLGGGSLGGSLYLGMIAGYDLLWLQPLMLILGIVMLSAIGYVALSTEQRPFEAINEHVSPVLGWGWAIATLMANLVWAMPQFALGTAAMQQNLGLFTGENGDVICTVILLGVSTVIVLSYDRGGSGLKMFEIMLKVMVGVIVLSFFGVVVAMGLEGALPWGEVVAGFVPDVSLLWSVPDSYTTALADSGSNQSYWESEILNSQRGRMVTAAATAVGINMTFLLPYSLLKRKWDRDFRGLAVFDLSVGLFFPFVLATSCVVIAAATQFHGQPDSRLLGEGDATAVPKVVQGKFEGHLQKLMDSQGVTATLKSMSADEKREHIAGMPIADRRLAAMLIDYDSGALALSLEKLTGKGVAQTVFGIGVLGMAVSTIIILMLINGFTICEMLGKPSEGTLHRIGSVLPGLTGGIGALLLWKTSAKFYVVQPTSIFGMMLLPIAYLTFFLMMNNRALLGENMPRGGKRVAINLAMGVALGAATIGAGWSIWTKAGATGVGLVVIFLGLAGVVHFVRGSRSGGGHVSDSMGAVDTESGEE